MFAAPPSSPAARGARLSRIAQRAEPSAEDDDGNTEWQAVSKAAAARAGKWSTLRREILPSPALMTVSAKVQHIINMLKRRPEERAESDVKILYQWLMNQEKLSSLFTTMSEVTAKKLCKEMEFLHLSSGQVVVNQGDKGSTCFILMSGIVSVYVRTPEEQLRHQRLLRSSIVSGSTRRLSALLSSTNYGNKVVTLTPGATFGELCLIEPDSKRSATVIVEAQMANFIVLTAASYLRMTRSQTIEGTITDNIAFLQHLLIFKNWSKMELMHIINSMKHVTVSAGQYLTRKGTDADSFFVFLRGEAVESVNLMVNESSELSMGEACGVQRSITVELTFLGKFDIAGEYLASEKKVPTCPVDIRATTDVDCLVLTRKLFNVHFAGKEIKPHVLPTRKWLRTIAEDREAWREARILQALQYPTLRVPITRKLMRLSGNCCLICGRRTHIAGDQLCMDLPAYNMADEKKKKREENERDRSASKHRISVVAQPSAGADMASKIPARSSMILNPVRTDLPSLLENDSEQLQSPSRLGRRLVTRQWQEAERSRAVRLPQRPMTTPSGKRNIPLLSAESSIKRSSHISRRQEEAKTHRQQSTKDANTPTRSVQEEIQHIRDTWPSCWGNSDSNRRQETKTSTRLQSRSRSPSPSASPRHRPANGSVSARV